MIDSRLSFPLFLLLLPLLFSGLTSSLDVTSASPCQPVCASSVVGTTADDVVCFDNEFKSTTNGTNFHKCVECELGSTAVDSANGATDVNWGLYNLRYAVSACVYSFPVRKITISTPCQVSCDPLQDALTHNLNASSTIGDLSYCDIPSFHDSAGINKCAECYGRMDGMAYMGNFIQALHIACLDRPEPGEPFPVASNTLFNATPIATPQPSSSAAPKPGRPANLALIISLPVVFGVLVIAGIIACCFYSARHRRRIMAQRNAMRRIQDKSSPTFPSQHHEYYQQQYSQSQGFESVAAAEPNYFSPVSDHKENPYIQFHQPQPQQQEQPPPTHQPHQSQQQYPQYRSYTPADYASPITATTSPIPSFPLDTSQIGPGPNQKQIHTLHDQYFPPPPPPTNLLMQPQPPQFQFTPLTSASMSMPPQAPPIPTQAGIGGGVESLRQHQMKIPSLGMPDPSRRKKSLEAQRAQQSQSQSQRPSQEEIPLTDYRARDGGEGRVGEVEASESPQVFVFDEVEGRYVKERSPTG